MKNKFLKYLFVFLSVIVILVSLSLPVFASDQPMFSTGISSDVNYIYSGNTDILLSVGLADTDTGEFFNLSTSLNPSISSDMLSEGATDYFDSNWIDFGTSTFPLINGYYDTFRASDDYFDYGIVNDNSFFASNFALFYEFGGSDYLYDSFQVTARDFYFYLDPNDEILVSGYDDFFAESYLLLDSSPIYDYAAATGIIDYCLAGQEDSANNRLTYNYSLPSDSGSYSQFYTLPLDQSFSGTYSEPTLIYVEYLSLTIPFNQDIYVVDGLDISGTYINFNMDYRNIDLSSSDSSTVDPISPINPGVFRDYTSWIGTAVSGFLDLQIVDGFSLGGILMVIIAFMITMWFLKVFAGG